MRTFLLALSFSILSTATAAAQSTAYKTGEQKTGSTTQCYYNGLGKQYTRTVHGYELCPLSITVDEPSSPRPVEMPKPEPSSITAFKTGEQKTNSTTQCYYNGLGKQYTKTVQSYELCPLSITVQQ